MNKKIFGIKIGTILQALVCLVVAFAIWFIVKYMNLQEASSTDMLAMSVLSFLL